MDWCSQFLSEHDAITRRWFFRLGAAGVVALSHWPGLRADQNLSPECAKACAEALKNLEFLTPPEKFGDVSRGRPLPSKLPAPKKREVGLTPETWRLEVIPDPVNKAEVSNPLSKERGTALDWNGLMQLAKTHAVNVPKIMTCNNIGRPLGM